MSVVATPRSRLALLLNVGAAMIVLLGATRGVAFVFATENFTLEDLWELAGNLIAPVFLAMILGAIGAALQYLFDIRAVVVSDMHDKRGTIAREMGE